MKKVFAFLSHLMVVVCVAVGVLQFFPFDESSQGDGSRFVEYDHNMSTRQYTTEVTMKEDASFELREMIDVTFLSPRHGIYRYIPDRGVIEGTDQDGRLVSMPYSMSIDLTELNLSAQNGFSGSILDELSTDTESGNFVAKIGSADYTISGDADYEIVYDMIPTLQDKDFHTVYVNLFPTGWQNEIPAGSRFSMTFPAEVDPDAVRLYHGSYGSKEDALDLFDLSWDGLTLYGTLLEDLEFPEGVTLYVDCPEGYFTGVRTFNGLHMGYLAVAGIILLVTAVMFLIFGKDGELIRSVQFQPPQGLDSAEVGYIIDGRVEDRDIISLIIYWADQGFLTMRENGEKDLYLEKTGTPLPEDAPEYAKVFYNRIFKKGSAVKVSSLNEKCYDTISAAKDLVRSHVDSIGGVYTKSSVICRIISSILAGVPFLLLFLGMESVAILGNTMRILSIVCLCLIWGGCIVFSLAVDRWYGTGGAARKMIASAGLGMSAIGTAVMTVYYYSRMAHRRIPDARPALLAIAAATILCVLITGFMKKRTDKCLEWMGYLTGLREFIETAELDRLKVLAQDNPQWFYHILPYTFVFGLAEVFAEKLKGLALTPPDWYTSTRSGDMGWNYYVFHHSFMNHMDQTTRTMTSVPENTGGSGGSSGGFSSGGGGFSGGGFGGGGGGSW